LNNDDYLYEEIVRLAAEPEAQFSPSLHYNIDPDGTLALTNGMAMLDEELYHFNYSTNMFNDTQTKWDVLDRQNQPVSDDINNAIWGGFITNVMPTVVMNLYNNPKANALVPKKFIESIPGLKDKMDMFGLSKVPGDIGNVGANIDWANVDNPGWHMEKTQNWRNGVFIAKNHDTGQTTKHPFTFSEKMQYYNDENTGEVMYHQSNPTITWHPKPKPTRLRQNYERMIMGDISQEAIKDQKQKGTYKDPTAIPAVPTPAQVPPPPPSGQAAPTTAPAPTGQPAGTPAPAPAPAQTPDQIPVTIENKMNPVKVSFTGDWYLGDNNLPSIDCQVEYIGMEKDKPVTFTATQMANGQFEYEDWKGPRPTDGKKFEAWYEMIGDAVGKLPAPDKSKLQPKEEEQKQEAPVEAPKQEAPQQETAPANATLKFANSWDYNDKGEPFIDGETQGTDVKFEVHWGKNGGRVENIQGDDWPKDKATQDAWTASILKRAEELKPPAPRKAISQRQIESGEIA